MWFPGRGFLQMKLLLAIATSPLGKLGTLAKAFRLKVAMKFMSNAVEFNDEIVGVLTYMLLGQLGKHVSQREW